MKTLQDSEIGKDLPCLHCQLIAMGEMACYHGFCPHCGNIPPNLVGAFPRLMVLEQEKKKKIAKQKKKNQQLWQHLQQQNHPNQIQIVGEKNQHWNQAEV